MQLHIIGSGCPHPLADWFGTSFILQSGESLLMFDCGPGTTHKMVKMGLNPTQVDHLFLTHHHFDHNADFPCFALTRWDRTNDEQPLYVYGPEPTEAFTEQLLGEEGAFAPDVKARIDHPTSREVHRRRGGVLPRPAPVINARDLASGETITGDGWTIEAREVRHVQPTLTSLAYRVETGEGSVVFSGDCGYCDAIVELADGADTLQAACAMLGPSDDDEIISDVITGSVDAARIAREAGMKRLVLSHAAPGPASPAGNGQAITEAARIFDGEVMFPPELSTIDL